MAHSKKLTSLLLCYISIFSSQIFADLRLSIEDVQVVEHSDLIVVGHLEKDSIKFILHETGPDRGASWEHHAVISVSEVLKGNLKENKIPIVILHGMDVKVDGRFFRKGYGMSSPGNPKDAIEIWDTGNSMLQSEPTVKDAGKDLIWFLSEGVRSDRTVADKSSYGISAPEVMQPLKLKDYFLAYLSDDPEEAVREQVERHPEIKERAQRYFDHMAVQRIIRNEDNGKIVEELLPYYLARVEWNRRCEARGAILTCGEVAGPYFLDVFENTQKEYLQDDIIKIWARIKYKDCVPLLISLLEEHDKFWAKQKLEKGWWNSDENSERRKKRRQIYGEVYHSVYALKEIGDFSAIPVIELTKDRWESIGFDNPQIVEECAEALKKFEEIKSGNYKHRDPIAIKTPEIIHLLEKETVEYITTDNFQMITIKVKGDKCYYRGKYLHSQAGKYSEDDRFRDIQKLVMHIKNNRPAEEVKSWKVRHNRF